MTNSINPKDDWPVTVTWNGLDRQPFYP